MSSKVKLEDGMKEAVLHFIVSSSLPQAMTEQFEIGLATLTHPGAQ
jgi:hypothetical protein